MITVKWYLDRNDERVKEMFDLKTKAGRIQYDLFVYEMKKQEKDYAKPIEALQILDGQYGAFLANEAQRFMISAGDAGMSRDLKPGHEDYDIFEASDINSEKRLLSVLKTYNGKIILFDDCDKVLRSAYCASVMKQATAPSGKRILEDPDDKEKHFEFTGRIIIVTYQHIPQLAESQDAEDIISQAAVVSDIYMTVPETIEIMERLYKNFEFPESPRLENKAEDDKERDTIMQIIKDNQQNIDPALFTLHTFQKALSAKRRVERANKMRSNPLFADLLGKDKDWKKRVTEAITETAIFESIYW